MDFIVGACEGRERLPRPFRDRFDFNPYRRCEDRNRRKSYETADARCLRRQHDARWRAEMQYAIVIQSTSWICDWIPGPGLQQRQRLPLAEC